MTPGNGLSEQSVFNSRLQPLMIKLATTANQSVEELHYYYGEQDRNSAGQTLNNGNVLRHTSVVDGVARMQVYDYDELNRLKKGYEVNLANGALHWQQTFIYDRYGNRRIDTDLDEYGTPKTSANIKPVIGDNPTINPGNNRFDDGQGYGYDVAGNVTSAPNKSFSYDAENHQVSYNGGQAKYIYDGDGRRVKKEAGNITTIFVYDAGGKLVAEYSNATPEPGSGGTSYLTSDSLGTPRVITDVNGNVKSRHDYLPFGEELSVGVGGRTTGQKYVYGVGDDGVKQKFTGKERDLETGLDYAQARYYSSTQGRFTSVDPLMASSLAVDPQTWNRYVYVTNNPLRYVDDDGLLKRDANGKLIFTVTRPNATATHPQDASRTPFPGELGVLYTDDGTPIEAFRQYPAIDNRMSFDCHGLSFADAQFYIDNGQIATLLEHDNYTRANEPQVGDIVVYTINNNIVHSATVTALDENGNITAVTGLGGIEILAGTTPPERGFFDEATQTWATPTYFRKNNTTAQQRQANAQRVISTPPKNVLTREQLRRLGDPPKMEKPKKKSK